jgi:hypothetical protein
VGGGEGRGGEGERGEGREVRPRGRECFLPQVTSKRTLQCVQVTDAPTAIVRPSVCHRPRDNPATMACPNFKNGPKNGLGPLVVNIEPHFKYTCKSKLKYSSKNLNQKRKEKY